MRKRFRRAARALLYAALLTLATFGWCAPSPFPEPSSANSLFKDRPFGPIPTPTPTPARQPISLEEPTPIPKSWWIAGAAIVALAVLAFLYGAVRAWTRANLFDRQYRFPASPTVEPRLGGIRSGGHLATIRFGEGPPPSKTEDT